MHNDASIADNRMFCQQYMLTKYDKKKMYKLNALQVAMDKSVC